jgi:hypothetical protein
VPSALSKKTLLFTMVTSVPVEVSVKVNIEGVPALWVAVKFGEIGIIG